MKLYHLFEDQYPFGVAVPLQRPDDKATVQRIYQWVQKAYGADAPMPEILVADHEKMQWAAQRSQSHVTIRGVIWGWYSLNFPGKVFISSRANVSRSKVSQATLAHEFTHYLQDVSDKYADIKPFTAEHVEMLEQEADEIMAMFMKS